MNKQRKTSHILNVFQYDNDGHVVLPASLTLSIAPDSNDDSSKVPTTAWVRALAASLGYVTLSTDQTITGLKTIIRSGDVLNFKIGVDNLYGLKVVYNQNELVPSGEATWSFVSTFNNGSGTGIETTPISFFRGVLVTGQRLLSASVNSNLLDYYGNNPSGRYPIYAYNTGVQQFASSIIVGETSGVVNAATGAIADLPSGVVANFKGRVIGSDAINSNEFVTLNQLASSYINGSGTTNYLSKFTSGSTLGNSLIYDNGTTVLIGTTTAPTPVTGVSFPLSITSSQATRIRIDSSRGAPNYANAGVGLYASGVQKWSFAHYSTNSGANYDFTIYNDALRSSAVLIKGSNGNVLIGTVSDNSNKLRVNGTGWFDNTVTATSFIKSGGTSSQFLKADGSLDSNSYLTSYTETDTLATVTGRGATTSSQIISTSSAGDGSIISRNDGSGTSWRGRIGHWNATADKSVWLATYNGFAVVGAHNNALNAWADLLVNCVDNSGSGGTVRLASSAFVGSNAILHAGNFTSYTYSTTDADGRFLRGTTNPGTVLNFTISIGNNGSYSYVQSHSSQPLELNPLGNTVRIAGNVALHAGNYNSYSPTLTGGGASGTWGIRITGFANQGTARLYSTDSSYNYDAANPYFGFLTYDGTRWLFQVSPGTPAAVRVAYADSAGSASSASNSTQWDGYSLPTWTNWSSRGSGAIVVGQLGWKNYGNNHVIFDASNSTSPTGSGVNNTNPDVAWTGTYPTLMGWNGSNTYGVRVDSARRADNVEGFGAGSFYRNLGFGSGFPSWDLNTVDPDRSGFTYSNGAPYTGPFIHIGASGYGMQFNANYGDGSLLAYRVRNGDNGTWSVWRRLIFDSGTWSISISGNASTASQVINNTDGAVLMESNASENNNWLWKEAAKAWGLFWFNRGTQSGQAIGSYTTVGAELMFMGGSSGIAMPTNWTGYHAGSNIAAMISNWNGYIYSASTVFAASDMRSPIFYDSNDTGRYIDPNGTSQTNSMRASEFRGNANVGGTGEATWHPAGIYSGGTQWLYGTTYRNNAATSNQGWLYFDGNYGYSAVGLYSSYRYQGVFAMGDAYKLPVDGTNTGSLYGIAWSHPNAGGAASNLGSHGMLILENGGFQGAWGGGSLRTPGSVYGTIFYDWSNTGYYLDPNSSSYLYSLVLSGAAYFRPQTWIQFDSSYGIYWPNNNGAHLYANNTSYTQLRIDGSRGGYGGIWDSHSNVAGIMYDSGGNGGVYREANSRWYFYYHLGNDCMGIGTSSTSSTYSLYLNKGVFAQSRIDAPIFYDTNDTGYYLDPASTTRLNDILGGGASSKATSWHKISIETGGFVAKSGTRGVGVYADGSNTNVFAYDYGTASYQHLYLEGSYVSSRGSHRAPIFYDSDNTGYYVDPASGSYLNGISTTNYLTASNCNLAVTGIAGQITLTTNTGFGGYFRATQHIVIENTTGGYHVYVLDQSGVGVVKYSGAQSWSAHSDARIKTVHSTLDNNLSKLDSINPIYYSFNNFADEKNRIGLIAQEVQEHFPELVDTDPKTNNLTLDYTGLIPVLLGAIKELKNKVEVLESRL